MPEDNSTNEQIAGQQNELEASAKKKRRYGENLDHFHRVNELEQIHTKQSFFDKLSERLASFNESKSALLSSKLSFASVLSFARQNRKLAILAMFAILLIFLAVIIIPIIPLQMQRSGGYAAFQEKNYTDAYRQLESYLGKRPADHAAAYIAAQAALLSGNEDYASRVIGDLYTKQMLPQEAGVGYYYALLNVKQPQIAIDALNNLLQKEPFHAGARLLRGFLLSDREGAIRQARDDFLQLDEILRGNEDFSHLQFLYRYLQKHDLRRLPIKLPEYRGVIRSALQPHVGKQQGLDGLIYQLNPSNDEEILRESLSPADIANLYFTYTLLKYNEIEEAKSALTGLLRNSADRLAVRQAAAFFNVYTQQYAEAKEQFEQMAQQLPADAKTLNNLALMEILTADGEVDINRLTDIYDRVADAPNVGAVGLNNSAYFSLLGGNYTIARQRLERIGPNGDVPVQVQFNQSLVDLLSGDVASAKERLAAIESGQIPHLSRYIVAVYEKSNDLDAAIDLLANTQAQEGDGDNIFIERIKLMDKNGDWRLAFAELSQFVENNRNHPEARYLLGKLALHLGEEDVLNAQKFQLGAAAGAGQYANALDGEIFLSQGDIPAAVNAYYQAVTSSASGEEQREYLLKWAMLYVDTAPAQVASVLRQYANEYDDPRIIALLAYALVDSDAAEAALYIDLAVAGGSKYIVNLYAGAALSRIGNYQSAIPLLEAAASEQPARIKALEFLQQAYDGAGNIERRLQVAQVLNYLNALARGEGPASNASHRIYLPNDKKIVNQVRVALSTGDDSGYQDALAAYADALKDAEENQQKRAKLLYSQATFETYYKKYQKSTSLFEEALALGVEDYETQIDIMLFYAEVLSLTEQYAQAAQVLQQIIELDGDQLLYRRLYAQMLASQSKRQEAADLLQRLLSDYPSDRNTYYDLANIYTEMEEYQVAIETLKQLLRIYPNDAPTYRLLAEVYSITGNSKKSQQYSGIYSNLN